MIGSKDASHPKIADAAQGDDVSASLDSTLSHALSRSPYDVLSTARTLQSSLGGDIAVRRLLSYTKEELCSRTSLSASDVRSVFLEACKHTLLPPKPTSVAELMHRSSVGSFDGSRLGFANDFIDDALDGGLLPGTITEISGAAGSGKTQLCLQLLLSAQLPTAQRGLAGSSIYISTEVGLPTDRLECMLASDAFASIRDSAMNDILTRKVESLEGLFGCLEKLSAVCPARNVRLIVIDSIAAVLRSDYGRDEALERSRILLSISHYLRSLAGELGIVVVVVNQVSSYMDPLDHASSHGTSNKVIPALGLTWDNCINARIMVEKTTRLYHSPERYGSTGATYHSSHGASVHPRGNGQLGPPDKRARYEHSTDTSSSTPMRRIKVVYAPHVGRKSIPFIITSGGIQGTPYHQ